MAVDVDEVALCYARALQTGAWETVIAMTSWMQDRLAQAALASSNPREVDRAKQRLCARLSAREIAGNQLRPEGIEDQYVFAPGTAVAVLDTDSGRASLAEPVLKRVWVRVTYPERTRALRDVDGVPIHAVSVGINIDRNGLVLKASVLGNLDIRSDSLDYRWPEPSDSGAAATANPNGGGSDGAPD